MKSCSDLVIIRQSSRMYQAERFLISVVSIFQSYYYMVVIAFEHTTDSSSYWKQNFLEVIFIIDLVMNFFVEYTPVKTGQHNIRKFSLIAQNYLKGQFLFDVIPIIPFHLISLPYNSARLLYLIKMIRIKRAMNLLNIKTIMRYVKHVY